MTKEFRTAAEIEKLVMAEALKHPECEGATGVTIARQSDERDPATWYANVLENGTPMCARAIGEIVRMLQRKYDLRD